MTETDQICPKCQSVNTYKDGTIWICAECFNEWTPSAVTGSVKNDSLANEPAAGSFVDSNGVILQNGDTVQTVKDLKIGKDTIKAGTKAKNIRLLDDPVDGHDISCKIASHGSIYLKCSVVKKVT